MFLVGVAVTFYWKFFFKGLIPFPGDLMVGAYFPWLDYKWGNAVGVAVKNTFISDIFSAFFPWKVEFAKSYINHQWPLWSPLLYSGYPLFANFNSGYLNPFNLLLVIFGSIDGWSLMVFSQPVFSMITMYSYLRTINKRMYPALVGSIVYGFGGFAMTWSQYVNAGFVMIWLPYILCAIELSKIRNNYKYLFALTPLFFLVVTSGHFQGLVYTAVISIAYIIFRVKLNDTKKIITFFVCSFLAIGLSAIQLIPTIELLKRSVRFDDGMIAGENYGLLPKQNLITLVAPDFFGNPTTGNFWGFYNYHETISYFGIFGFVALIYGLLFFKKLSIERFFVISTIIGLLLQFDTPIGRAIYIYKVPFLSTCAAGRIGIVILFGVSILTSSFLENIQKMTIKEIFKIFVFPVMFIVLGVTIPFLSNMYYKSSGLSSQLALEINNDYVALRNMVVPLCLVFTFFIFILISNRIVWVKYLLIFIVLADLFRFGWKYLPFVPESYIFPNTEVTDYIKSDNTIFRIDKERGEVLPPNTWMGYGMMSPSGFDPLAVTNYVKAYREDLNGYTAGSVSRYSEIDRVNAEALGKYNVKYLLAIKRNEKYEIPGDILSYKIDENEWSRVFETKSVAVLLNSKFQERARIIDGDGNDSKGSADIVSYESNKVIVKFSNIDGERLLLADTYYPGWVASINGNKTKIGDENRPFRTVDIRGIKEGKVVFEYKPKSFYIGLLVSGISFGVWLGLVIFQAIKKASR